MKTEPAKPSKLRNPADRRSSGASEALKLFRLVENPPSFEPARKPAKVRAPIPKLAGASRLVRLAKLGEPWRLWYPEAFAEASEVCRVAGWSVVRFAEVLAITSPQVSVLRNLRRTYLYLQTGEHFENTPQGIRRTLEHYEKTGELSKTGETGAPKVRAFRSAILGDSSAIVLDVWMARALKVSQLSFQRVAVRFACEKLIRRVSDSIGEPPREAQARIWAGCILEANRKPARLPILQEYNRFARFGFDYPRTGAID